VFGGIGTLYVLVGAAGSIVGGALYESVGAFAPFILCIPLDIAALLIVLFGVEESGKRGDLAAIPFLWWLGASA